jgi:tetratricopeptide (TPR) repeat protein
MHVVSAWPCHLHGGCLLKERHFHSPHEEDAMKYAIAMTLGMLAFPIASPAAAQLQPVHHVDMRSAKHKRAAAHSSDAVQAGVAGDHARALDAAEAAIAANPKDAWGYYLRGDALVSLGQTDAAVASFAEAERRFPNSDPWAKSVAMWGAAHAYEEAARCSEAGPIYARNALFTAPLDPAAAALAREHATRGCAPPPAPPLTQYEIAAAQDQSAGDYSHALALADESIARNPADGWAHYMRADALASLGRFDQAVNSFREAERLFVPATPKETSIAIWGEANALKEAGRCTEASPVYLRYAAFVAHNDVRAAAMAREYANKKCVPVGSGR